MGERGTARPAKMDVEVVETIIYSIYEKEWRK